MLERIARLDETAKPIGRIVEILNAAENERLVMLQDIAKLSSDLTATMAEVAQLTDDIALLKRLQADTPSITWLVRNRFKQIALITVGVVGFSVIVVSLLTFPQIHGLLDAFLEALRKYVGL